MKEPKNTSRIIFFFATFAPQAFCRVVARYPTQAEIEAQMICEYIPMQSISPYAISRDGDANTYGVEYNKWYSRHPSCRKFLPVFGYGANIGYGDFRVSMSPYIQISGPSFVELAGLAIGPEFRIGDGLEVGVNSRFWVALIGGEMTVYQKTNTRYGLYLFFPLHEALLQ